MGTIDIIARFVALAFLVLGAFHVARVALRLHAKIPEDSPWKERTREQQDIAEAVLLLAAVAVSLVVGAMIYGIWLLLQYRGAS